MKTYKAYDQNLEGNQDIVSSREKKNEMNNHMKTL